MSAPIENQQAWRKALERFSPVRYAFFREWLGTVLPVVVLGNELPDRERIQYGLSGFSFAQLAAANSPMPAVGLASTVDVRLERIYWTFAYSTSPGDRMIALANNVEVGLGFATEVWNPFDTTATIFQPQWRPLIEAARFQPGSTDGVQGTGVTPPAFGNIAHRQQSKVSQGTTVEGSLLANVNELELGPAGVVIPRGSLIALAPTIQTNFAGPGTVHANLWASFTYRELDS